MKKIIGILVLALAFIAVFSACNKEEETITNTIETGGNTYKIVYSACGLFGGAYHMDCDTENGIHGHGEFPASYVGKTTDLKGDFFLEFNPQSGPSFIPKIKSGTVTVKEADKGFNITVDAVENGGGKFKMSVYTEDKGENF